MEWKEGDVLEVLVNPIYTGIGEYPQMVPDEIWIKSVSKLIAQYGAEKVLRTMLDELRTSLKGDWSGIL